MNGLKSNGDIKVGDLQRVVITGATPSSLHAIKPAYGIENTIKCVSMQLIVIPEAIKAIQYRLNSFLHAIYSNLII